MKAAQPLEPGLGGGSAGQWRELEGRGKFIFRGLFPRWEAGDLERGVILGGVRVQGSATWARERGDPRVPSRLRRSGASVWGRQRHGAGWEVPLCVRRFSSARVVWCVALLIFFTVR